MEFLAEKHHIHEMFTHSFERMKWFSPKISSNGFLAAMNVDLIFCVRANSIPWTTKHTIYEKNRLNNTFFRPCCLFVPPAFHI